jgi:hypothetical protein
MNRPIVCVERFQGFTISSVDTDCVCVSRCNRTENNTLRSVGNKYMFCFLSHLIILKIDIQLKEVNVKIYLYIFVRYHSCIIEATFEVILCIPPRPASRGETNLYYSFFNHLCQYIVYPGRSYLQDRGGVQTLSRIHQDYETLGTFNSHDNFSC